MQVQTQKIGYSVQIFELFFLESPRKFLNFLKYFTLVIVWYAAVLEISAAFTVSTTRSNFKLT